jgi:hypothetical protein
MAKPGPRPIGDHALTGAERAARYRAANQAKLSGQARWPRWHVADTPETLAKRIVELMGVAEARQLHAALSRAIKRGKH